MLYMAYVIHVVVSIFLILVVLLQQGKGADLSVFGGGATQAAFGARGAANILHKFTVWGFVAFIMTTMAIGFLQTRERGTVMRGVDQEVVAPIETEPAPAAQSAAGTEGENPEDVDPD